MTNTRIKRNTSKMYRMRGFQGGLVVSYLLTFRQNALPKYSV